MHLQSTYTLHLQHIQSEAHLKSSRTPAVELFCGNIQRIKAVGYFHNAYFQNATLPNNYLPLHQKLATFPGTFGDIPRKFWLHSLECLISFPGIFGDIPRKVWWNSQECLTTFLGMFDNISRNITFPTFPAFPAFRSPFLYSLYYT